MKRKLSQIWVFLFLIGSTQLFAAEINGKHGTLKWTFNTESGELVISGSGKMKDFNNYYYSYDKRPAWQSFKENIKSIIIRQGVTSIGRYAFKECVNVTKLEMPPSLQMIRQGAFEDCRQLKAIYISDISSLCSLNFEKNDRETLLFGYADDLYLNKKLLKDLVIPDNVTKLGMAFHGCRSLCSISFPKNFADIVEKAFGYCTNVTSIVWNVKKYSGNKPWESSTWDDCLNTSQITSFIIGNDVEEIPAQLCNEMKNITSINIPSSVKKIGNLAFGNCKSLEAVYITDLSAYCKIKFEKRPADIYTLSDYYSYKKYGIYKKYTEYKKYHKNKKYNYCYDETLPLYHAGNLYLNNKLVTDLIIPSDIKVIGQHFQFCTSIESVSLHKDIQQMGLYDCNSEECVFEGCKNLSKINWNIRKYSYNNSHCNKDAIDPFWYIAEQITSFEFGDGVEEIPDCCCQDMVNLQSIHIPNGVKRIGHSAFSNCGNIKKINIPSSVEYIETNAFNNTYHLSAVYIDDLQAYCNCKIESNPYAENLYLKNRLLTELNITNGIKKVDARFAFCTSIESVNIPSSVQSICGYAFNNCRNLKKVTIPDNVKEIGSNAFKNCTGLVSVFVPTGIKKIGNNAFDNVGSIEYYGELAGVPWGAFCRNGYNDGTLVYRDADKKELIRCSSAVVGEVVVPESVSKISKNSFYNCPSLTSVIILNEQCDIDANAFYKCKALKSITAHKSVKLPPEIGKEIQIIRIGSKSPNLEIIPFTVRLIDANRNGLVEVDEPCYIFMMLSNNGEGDAIGCKVVITPQNGKDNILIVEKETKISDLKSGEQRKITIPFHTDSTAKATTIPLDISIVAAQGNKTNATISVETTTFLPPRVTAQTSLYSFNTVAQKAMPITLSLAIQNNGKGIARDIDCTIELPSSLHISSGDKQKKWDILLANGQQTMSMIVTADANIPDSISIPYTLTEKYGKYAESGTIPIVFGKTPTFKLSTNEEKSLAIAGQPQISRISGSSVQILQPQWFKKHNNTKNPKNPFPYAAIKLELKGNKESVDLAKQRLSVMEGGIHCVTEKDTKETNTIWLLIHCKHRNLSLDCGDGCEPVILDLPADGLHPNEVWYGQVEVSIP